MTVAPRTVDCPRCGAPAGSVCVGSQGHGTRDHKERISRALRSRPVDPQSSGNHMTDTAIGLLRKHSQELLAQHVEEMAEALMRLGIRQHERAVYGGRFVPSGTSCALCRAQAGLGEQLQHEKPCLLRGTRTPT